MAGCRAIGLWYSKVKNRRYSRLRREYPFFVGNWVRWRAPNCPRTGNMRLRRLGYGNERGETAAGMETIGAPARSQLPTNGEYTSVQSGVWQRGGKNFGGVGVNGSFQAGVVWAMGITATRPCPRTGNMGLHHLGYGNKEPKLRWGHYGQRLISSRDSWGYGNHKFGSGSLPQIAL